MLARLRDQIRKLNTARIISYGFGLTILTGGLILWMPFCAAPGQTTSFSDAMFTAATCVCVTGLVTVTPALHWSLAGKVVMLLLIQIGGIGVVFLASIIFITLRRKISLRNRKVIQESGNFPQMSGLVRLVKRVVLCILCAEAAGALCYAVCFVPQFGLARGLGQAVFTSVSAFCNAGIDLLGADSLMPYADHPLVNIVTMTLIVVAGLGFTVWWDVAEKIRKVFRKELSPGRMFRCLRLHSKLVLVTTGILLFGGTLLIFLFEHKNPGTLAGKPLWVQIMASAFQSVTTRTAGFLTIDQARLSGAAVVLCLFLMFIGGSPMGTAGGIKTTTLAVMVLTVAAALRGDGDIETHHRRLKERCVRSAMVVTVMGFAAVLIFSILLMFAMPEADVVDVLYEITSAIGTVGLTRGLTPRLSPAGKWIVLFAMYIGRIGPLTLGTAVTVRLSKNPGSIRHLAEEDIMIG